MYVCICIEKQQVVQGVQSRKQKTQSSDLDYKLLMQYHSRLSDMPSLLDLTSYFVTASIITKSDGQSIENIIATESQTVALRKLLNKLSLTLLLGRDDKSFNKILRIMQIYGSDIVQLVANEMLEAALRVTSPVQTTLSIAGI